MSAGEHRRNGKAASCEPCRKGKIRCDHQRPVCGRCSRRGQASRCIYHPAPLTRSRALDETNAAQDFQGAGRPTPGAGVIRTPDFASRSSFSTRPSYSTATVVPNAQAFALPWSPMTPTSDSQLLPPFGRQACEGPFREESVRRVKDLLRPLKHYRFIQKLLVSYGEEAEAANVPRPILMAFSDSLEQTAASYELDGIDKNEDKVSIFANDILRNTSKTITITPDLDWRAFVEIFTGDNIRLEALGLMYAITARACLLGLAWDNNKRGEFVHALYLASATCLHITRVTAPEITDVLLWHAFDDARLSTHVDGDASLAVYRRLGELSTDIFECGIHRESTITPNAPFFLAECRRRTFSASYHIDKFVSALIDGPPRILKRYSDCVLPLDLADDDLLGDAERVQAAKSGLTSDGWSKAAHYAPTSWQRVRYMLGVLREETHELQLQPSSRENMLHLKDLAIRCQESQQSLPAHLRYDPQCWQSSLSPNVCLMLTVLHLNYLQNYFQVQRLLAKTDSEASNIVLRISAETVATVLQVGNCLNRAIFMRHDFPYVVLCYGLPAAAVLVTALQNAAKSPGTAQIPEELSRSTLLRHLSVFISHVESICSPGDGNYDLCVQASRVLSRILDEILDNPSNNVTQPTSTMQEPPNFVTTHDPTVTAPVGAADNMSITDMDIFNGTGEGLDGIDLAAWVKSIDWAGTGGEWTTF